MKYITLMNYYKIMKHANFPQWAKNRLSYKNDKFIIESLIVENKNWSNFYKSKNQIVNSILHQEKIFYLEGLLDNLDNGLKINE